MTNEDEEKDCLVIYANMLISSEMRRQSQRAKEARLSFSGFHQRILQIDEKLDKIQFLINSGNPKKDEQ